MRKIAILLITIIMCSVVGCSSIQSEDLMKDRKAGNVIGVNDLTEKSTVITDLGTKLFQECFSEENNTLISPVSILYAMSMVANGAEGDTLNQIETTLGMSANELNNYLYSYKKALPQGDKYEYHLANSIWFKDDDKLTINEDFLQINADYYEAEIYKSAFDNSTLKDINNWVKNHTDKMIPEIINEIPERAIMYLINALAFEAEWDEKYEKSQVREDTFHHPDGSEETVDFMFSDESVYLEDDNTTGFIKYYKDKSYAFAALLPKPGVRMEDYVDSLSGEKIQALLENRVETTVQTSIPVFETEYTKEISEILKNLGIKDAFEIEKSDFSGLGTYENMNICISKVLHKTYISVDEQGTKAAAVTSVEMECGSAMPMEIKKVYLERPFVYMLLDCESNVPFFIGTTMQIGK